MILKLFALTLVTLGCAVFAHAEPPLKECQEKAEKKSLSKGAHEDYVNNCVREYKAGEYKITRGEALIAEKDRPRVIECGKIADGRGLSGESLDRFMGECLGRR